MQPDPAVDTERRTTAPHAARHDKHDRMMWLMMLGCCLVPVALIIGGVTVGSLVGVRPWLLAIAGVLAVATVIAHRVSGGVRCELPAGNTDPLPQRAMSPDTEPTRNGPA